MDLYRAIQGLYAEKQIVEHVIALFESPARENRSVTWLANLTERRHFVLKGVLDGLETKEIARQIGRSESAVKAALRELYKAAGVRKRSELVRVALKDGFDRKPLVFRPSRGRRSMTPTEREEVAERMHKYWANRRAQKEVQPCPA